MLYNLTGGVINEQSISKLNKQVVTEIAEKLKASKATIVVDYRGLTVAEVTELRKNFVKLALNSKFTKTL